MLKISEAAWPRSELYFSCRETTQSTEYNRKWEFDREGPISLEQQEDREEDIIFNWQANPR